VLDALIDRENRDVAGPAQAPVGEDRLKVAKDLRGAIRARHHPADEVRAWKVQRLGRDGLAPVLEQMFRLGTKEPGDIVQ
jgi:hypothetical protein